MNQEQLNKKFLKAIKNDDLDESQFLLSQGAEIHYHYEEALFTCCEAQHKTTTMFQFLIEQGSDLNTQSQYYYSLLDVCVEYGLNHYIELLLTYDKPSKVKMKIAFTKACRHGQLETVKYFLSKHKKKEQDFFSFQNYLCLDLAVNHNHLHIVEFLNQNFRIEDTIVYNTKLLQATKKNYVDIAKHFVQLLISINKIDDNMILDIAMKGNLEIFKYLFEQNFYIKEPLSSSIKHASSRGNLSIVDYILEVFNSNNSLAVKFDNITSSSLEISAFSSALISKHYHIVEYFIIKGLKLEDLPQESLNNISEDMQQWSQNKKLQLSLENNLLSRTTSQTKQKI